MQVVELDEAAWVNGRGYRKQQLVSEEELAAPGSWVQVVVMDAGETIPDHYHKRSREFYRVLAGECRLIVNGETHRLQPGDMLLMEPGDVHRVINEGDEPFTLLVVKANAAPDDTFWLADE